MTDVNFIELQESVIIMIVFLFFSIAIGCLLLGFVIVKAIDRFTKK